MNKLEPILTGSGHAKTFYFKQEDGPMFRMLKKVAEEKWVSSVSEYVRKAIKLQYEYDIKQYPEIFRKDL